MFVRLRECNVAWEAFPYCVAPSADGMIVGFPPTSTDAAELLVPKSIPIIFLFVFFRHSLSPYFCYFYEFL